MKQIVLAAVAALIMAAPAGAAQPSDAQLGEFYRTCMGIAQNDTLCACKRDAAPRLIDATFMDVVIAAMKGKAPAPEYNVPYNDYIAHSNAVCIPGY